MTPEFSCPGWSLSHGRHGDVTNLAMPLQDAQGPQLQVGPGGNGMNGHELPKKMALSMEYPKSIGEAVYIYIFS